MVQAYCDVDDVEGARAVITDMNAAGIAPDCETYNAVVSVFVTRKDVPAAQGIIVEMKADGIAPNSSTYGMLIKAFVDRC